MMIWLMTIFNAYSQALSWSHATVRPGLYGRAISRVQNFASLAGRRRF